MSDKIGNDLDREKDGEAKVRERREFLKSSAVAVAGLTFGAAMVPPAGAQIPPVTKQNLQLNATAKSFMPDGSLKGREEILSTLNLDPTTPPDAWLAIFKCGSNAGALALKDIRTLMQKGVLKENMLLEHQVKQLRR